MEILLTLLVGFIAYFLPSIVAEFRGHPQRHAICVLNLFLGWTVLGWIIALIWASTAVASRRTTPEVPTSAK